MVDRQSLLGRTAWNYADNYGAVSKGATLADQCLNELRESFRRSGLTVHEVSPAALSSETLGTDKRIFHLKSALRVLMHRRRVSGRVVQLIAGTGLFWRHCFGSGAVPFGLGV